MAYTNERFKGFGKAISKSSSKEVELEKALAKKALAKSEVEEEKEEEKSSVSKLMQLFNVNPNRRKVKKITGAKGTRMFKPKRD